MDIIWTKTTTTVRITYILCICCASHVMIWFDVYVHCPGFVCACAAGVMCTYVTLFCCVVLSMRLYRVICFYIHIYISYCMFHFVVVISVFVIGYLLPINVPPPHISHFQHVVPILLLMLHVSYKYGIL
jgi:hypothetical protein